MAIYVVTLLCIFNVAIFAASAFLYYKSKQKKIERIPDKDALEVLADLQRGGAILRIHHVPGDSVYIRSPRQ
jgi:hypothetical protein